MRVTSAKLKYFFLEDSVGLRELGDIVEFDLQQMLAGFTDSFVENRLVKNALF